jgi:hypothetical protein
LNFKPRRFTPFIGRLITPARVLVPPRLVFLSRSHATARSRDRPRYRDLLVRSVVTSVPDKI